MTRLLAKSAFAIVILLQFVATVSAGPLDEYYLQQFGEVKSGQLQKAILSSSGASQEPPRCGMPLKKGLRRDWNLLEQSTQKVLSKQLASPVLNGEQTLVSPSGKFKIHYTTTGADAVPSFAWVQTVAQTFDDVAAFYTARQWQLAPTNGNIPYDVFLRDLAPQGFYGVTNSDQSASTSSYPNAFTSWMELDNNFTDSIYKIGIYTPLQSLQITAAHEYHHAIQYGYNYYFDIWYAEATSTWMEDELYDDVNQLYNYIPSWFNQSSLSLDIPVSTSTGGGYGRWIFNRYLTEKHGPAVVRGAWERLATLSSPDGNSDIPMTPVLEGLLSSSYSTPLGNDFFGFTKRVYTRDWSTHTSEIDKIHTYSPVATYSVYPVNRTVTSPKPSVTLPHYSFAYYKFTPTSGVSSLTITISKSSGIQTALFKNGNEIAADGNGFSYSTYGLVTSDELALLIANSSSIDGHTANFSTDGSLVAVTEPTDTPPPSSTSAGSGSGCFIATAAYGSYLHPQVQRLRNFRDDYLLINAPGRAFVTLYYHFSPPLADFIAKHEVLRGVTRLALTPLVFVVVQPLIAFVLLLLLGALLLVLRRRVKTPRLAISQSLSSRI